MSAKSRSPGCDLIKAERMRQLDKLKWSHEHDDAHVGSELAIVAACYAMPERALVCESTEDGTHFAFVDPFPLGWDDAREDEWIDEPTHAKKLLTWEVKRIRLLEKAGALIAAEIDRLLRKQEGP